MADKQDLSSTGFSSVLENLNKKTGSNYCAICDIKTKSRTNFISHIRGLRHQSQLRVIETAGFETWTKTEAKKVKRNIRQVGQSEKSARRIRRSRCRHKASPQSKRSQGTQSKAEAKKQKVRTINEKGRDDRKLSSPDYSHLREAFHSEILNDSKSSSAVVKTPCVVPLDSNQTENLSISPFSSYSEMERRGNFRVPPHDSLLPLPHFNSRYSSSNFQDGMLDSRPQYWHQFPPRANYRGRYQPQYGRDARAFPPAGFLPFKQQNGRQGMKPGDGTLTKSKGSTKGGSQNEVGGQARSFSLSKEGHGSERNSQTPRSGRNPKSYHKSNDGYNRRENFSNNTDPHLEASFNTQLYSFFQPAQDETACSYNTKDRRGVQSEHEHRRSSYSPSGSEKRRSAERQRDSANETSGSRRRSNLRSSDDTHGRYDSFGNDTEARSLRGAGNEKAWPKHTEKSVECLRTNQSRKKEDGEQSSKTNENVSRKSIPDGKSSDSDKTKAQPSKSDNLATPKSPTFSNVAMQRMNARLHSFTKYGKMPTSGQIRNLAVNASPGQEKRDGKLQEWSKKMESHHNLTAQDKELINRLVNYSCSRREQKKLEFCLREHARSRKKLTLPRFNLQLSGMEDCKEPSGVDDSVNSMVTEVVDCLPEDVLNSLINLLNSDVDEYVAVNLPLSPDAEEGKGVCISNNLKSGSKRLDEDVFITVDEVGGNSSCDETADGPVQQHTSSDNSHVTSCHSGEIVRRLSLPNDQNHESSNTVAVHSSPVKATEQLARGSSLEICESQEVPNKNSPEADQQQMVCVDVKVKEKLFQVEARNIEKCPDYGQCRENKNVVGTQSSGNSVKTLAGLENSGIQVKNEQPDSQMTDFEIIELSPVKSQSSSMLPSLTRVNSVEELTNGHMSVKQGMTRPNVRPEVITLEGNSNDRTAVVNSTLTSNRNKHGLDSTVRNLSLPSEYIRPFPGLSYITRPLHKSVEQPAENRTGPVQVNKPKNFGSIFNLPSLDHRHVQGGANAFQAVGNQQFECSSDLPAAVAATPVIKIEHSSDNAPNGDAEEDEFFLPKISSVTSIRGSENFIGNNSFPLAACLETSLKQEPVSPVKVTVVTLSGNDEEGSELNCSKAKVRSASATESSVSTPIPNNSSHSRGLHNAAAASFPSVIHRVSSLSQKEDAEKISEVSSSTGILIDEVHSASLGLSDNLHSVGRNEGASSDLIRELLSITSSEEKLVQQASEAERKIAELTASLEEWKRKKYEIEHKQMKLRMKRQELLLLNAAKGSIPRDKYGKASFHSSANDRISECGSGSDEEKGSVASMQSASLSLEKTASDSDSSYSQLLNRKRRNNVSNFRKKKRKMNPKICGRGPNLRNKRTVDDDLSDSSVGFTNKRLRKHRSRSRSSLTGGRCSSSDRSTHKSRCLDRSPEVVVQPFQLSSGGGSGGKIVVNNNDDIIVLEDSPSRSLASTEEAESVDSSSEEGSVIIQEEVESVTSQEDIIAPTPDTTVNIGALFAHDGAVIDLKVYDCYLYSCSLDCSAKRFSLFDPTNDKTSYEGHQKTVTSICLSPRKEVYTTSLDTYLRCFVAKTGVIVDSFEMKNSIICSCTGGGTLYLGLNSGYVLFFSFKTRKVMRELKSGNSCISQLATATQGAQRVLCVVANDGIVSLYDTSSGLLLRCLETRVRPPCCVQICDDSVYITTSEKSIVIHSLLSGKLVRMVNWAASATGLEIIDNYILSSSFDGLIRCHNINQDMVSHSIYYGAGNAMVMSMTAYKNWVFTGNRKGTIEAFKFDPSKQLACQYGRCRLKYGREYDVLHHVTIDHLPCVNLKTKKCPWTGCAHEFTPRTTIEGKQEHVKEHVICTY